MIKPTLLILPCNPCVRLGDYTLCKNWRIVLKHIGDLVDSGIVDLAGIDSCKPGIVLRGEEKHLIWCDRSPRWEVYGRDPSRLELLVDHVRWDLAWLKTRYKLLVYYVNVKAYHRALIEASRKLGFRDGLDFVDLSPGFSPLAYSNRVNLSRVRTVLLHGGVPL